MHLIPVFKVCKIIFYSLQVLHYAHIVNCLMKILSQFINELISQYYIYEYTYVIKFRYYIIYLDTVYI